MLSATAWLLDCGKDAHTLTTREKITHLMASANPVSSAVLLLQEVAPKNAGCSGSQTTGPQRIWTRFSGETSSIPSRAHQCRQDCVETSISEQPPSRGFDPRQPGGNAAGWQHGEFCCGLGSRKALSCSGKKPKHFVWYVWAHAGQRAVIISILPHVSSVKLRPRRRWVLRRLEAVTDASNNPVTRMQNLSLRTAILKSKSLNMAVREILSVVPRKQSFSSRHPRRHPGVEPGSRAQAIACNT